MFDTFVETKKETVYVPYEKTVHEHRAPTDDSIKLYKEIKEKAYNSILASISINDNTLNMKGIVYRDFCEFSIKCSYSAKLNGWDFEGTVSVKEWNINEKQDLIIKILDDLSKSMAVELLKGIPIDSIHILQDFK